MKVRSGTESSVKKFLLKIKEVNLTGWIFIGLFVGFLMGVFTPSLVTYIKPFQNLFLSAIKSAIAPLIFATIVNGIASAGSFKQLGIMGVRTFIYFEVITTLALIVGLLMVNLLQPGVGLEISQSLPEDISTLGKSSISFAGFIEHLMPNNIADAVARGDILQVVIFSTIFAFGALAVGESAKPVLSFCESLSSIMFKYVGYVMYLAPLGVCASLASAVAEHGLDVVLPLLKLVGSLYLSLIVFVLVILYPVCRLFNIPVIKFAKQIKDPIFWAFATSSSESAYPIALDRLEKLGIPQRIVNFVLPMGYSFNLDGSTLYLSLASIFVAQVSGIQLSLEQQILIMLTLMLTTKGVAAVPRTSIVVLSGTLTAFGLPLDGVALILGVDVFMDMGRSAINLLGNCLATAVVARWEGIDLNGFTPEPVFVKQESDKKLVKFSQRKQNS